MRRGARVGGGAAGSRGRRHHLDGVSDVGGQGAGRADEADGQTRVDYRQPQVGLGRQPVEGHTSGIEEPSGANAGAGDGWSEGSDKVLHHVGEIEELAAVECRVEQVGRQIDDLVDRVQQRLGARRGSEDVLDGLLQLKHRRQSRSGEAEQEAAGRGGQQAQDRLKSRGERGERVVEEALVQERRRGPRHRLVVDVCSAGLERRTEEVSDVAESLLGDQADIGELAEIDELVLHDLADDRERIGGPGFLQCVGVVHRGVDRSDPRGDRVDRGGEIHREVAHHVFRRDGELIRDRLDRREGDGARAEGSDTRGEI